MKRKEFMRTLKVSSMVVVLATSMILGGCSNSKNNENTSNAETAVESEESTPKADSTEDCKELENIENVMPAGAVVSSLQVNSLTETGDVVSENTDESSGSTSSNSGSSSSSGGNSSGSSSSSSSGSSSGSSSSSSSSNSATAHTHNWSPVYRTVHHDAVTHTEDQGRYEDQGYWDHVMTCNTCGAAFHSADELHAHQKATINANPDNSDTWHGGDSVKDIWVSNNVWVSNIVTVTDSPAWDEQVLDHYECSCGATK